MHLPLTTTALLAVLPAMAAAQASGNGQTTRYWDCCKPSCAWPGKAPAPIRTCDKNDNPLNDGGNTRSGCDSGGGAFMCSNQSPWAVNDDLAYGWAAVNIAGSNENAWCCACYELTFTSGPVQGKKMIVQASNTGGDLGNNHFDIAVRALFYFYLFYFFFRCPFQLDVMTVYLHGTPNRCPAVVLASSTVRLSPATLVHMDGKKKQKNAHTSTACTQQYGAPANGWGQRYGGISSKSECEGFPQALKAGCNWRFDWYVLRPLLLMMARP